MGGAHGADGPLVGEPFPDVTLPRVQGGERRLGGERDGVLLLVYHRHLG